MYVLCQGGRFMNNTMFDARELLVPGSAYDRGKSFCRYFTCHCTCSSSQFPPIEYTFACMCVRLAWAIMLPHILKFLASFISLCADNLCVHGKRLLRIFSHY